MRIETAEICSENVHERAACFPVITGLFQFNRFEYGIRIRIIRIFAGDHLFHFIRRSGTAFDDLLLPILREACPVLPSTLRSEATCPHSKRKGCETESGDIEAPGLYLLRRDRDVPRSATSSLV